MASIGYGKNNILAPRAVWPRASISRSKRQQVVTRIYLFRHFFQGWIKENLYFRKIEKIESTQRTPKLN
ncbi:hypothetical protein ACRALDRAFT_211116 [Sodiomyces alcalophilus JCM 7366]|uniref:uncharacterized protein n=1 Tax=Sodiomyces alcalophilus JCM 7366 TaxID=591952 RepID=UPI0039B44D35